MKFKTGSLDLVGKKQLKINRKFQAINLCYCYGLFDAELIVKHPVIVVLLLHNCGKFLCG